MLTAYGSVADIGCEADTWLLLWPAEKKCWLLALSKEKSYKMRK